MPELISTWSGRVVDNLPLADHLGGSAYRTTFADAPAAIKFFPATDLARLEQAAKLSHPNLLRILQTGRTELDGTDYAYVVTEFAEENLSQVLPERALTPDETRDVLAATLDALTYLQQQGFAHADLKPANIMAAHDQLKLSIDGVHRIGEPLIREAGPHDAPEAKQALTAASDIYSLGATLVEVLTQQLPPKSESDKAGPAVPELVPAPFREIAQHCLLRTPELRWSSVDIQAKLSGKAPDSRPTAPTVVRAPQPRPATSPAVPEAAHPRPAASSAPSRSLRPFIFVAIIAVIVIGIVLMSRHSQEPVKQSTNPTTAEQQPQSAAPQQTAAQPETSAPAPFANKPESSAAADKTETAPATKLAEPKADNVKHITDEPEAAADDDTPEPTASTHAGVLHQVMPTVIPQARRSITGKVRVKVRLDVDKSGNVVDSDFVSAGPSKYFSRAAMDAARQWKFAPNSEARAWTVEFDFRRSGTQVRTSQDR